MSELQATGERASDAPEDRSSDWVTVAEAARRLGISDRQARRWAGRLADADRKSDGRGGRHVRLSAIASKRETDTGQAQERTHDRTPDGHGPDMTGRRTDIASGLSERLAAAEAQVVELRGRVAAGDAEVAYLRAALEREQENTRAALARIEDSDARLASVLAATGRVQLSEATDATDASPTRSNPEVSPNWSTPAGNAAETVEAPRPWWRWWGRG